MQAKIAIIPALFYIVWPSQVAFSHKYFENKAELQIPTMLVCSPATLPWKNFRSIIDTNEFDM